MNAREYAEDLVVDLLTPFVIVGVLLCRIWFWWELRRCTPEQRALFFANNLDDLDQLARRPWKMIMALREFRRNWRSRR